jgi:hypothetical protein
MAGTPLGGMDPTHRQQRHVVLGLVGFLFLETINRGRLHNSTASDNCVNRGGFCNRLS